ncbi:MAG: hypothetical protein SPL13_04080, partial [Clostridia bacterium]|nr:hypothetical protein [Clostridia bacterium]
GVGLLMMTILTAYLLHLFADGLVIGLDVVVGHLVLGRKLDVESRGNGDVKLEGKIILCFDVLCFLSFVLEGLAEHVDFLFTDISEELFDVRYFRLPRAATNNRQNRKIPYIP